MARMLPSWSKDSKALAMSLISGMSKKLLGGRRISTSATWPDFLNGNIAHRKLPLLLLGRAAACSAFRVSFDDQGIDDRHAFVPAVHDHRIEIDLGDVFGMIESELR